MPFLHHKCAFFALLVCLFGFEVLIGEGGVGYRYFIVFYQKPKIKHQGIVFFIEYALLVVDAFDFFKFIDMFADLIGWHIYQVSYLLMGSEIAVSSIAFYDRDYKQIGIGEFFYLIYFILCDKIHLYFDVGDVNGDF